METADSRLTGLALAWLSTRAKQQGTRKELEQALRPLVEHRWSGAEWTAHFEALVEELSRSGLATARGRSGLELTTEGRAQALRFLGLDKPPARALTWKKLKQTYLLAHSLGLAPSRAVLERLARTEGMRAALLKRQHRLDGTEAPSLGQVRDRLLWRQLGVETTQRFTLRAVQAHLLGKLLGASTTDPSRAVEQLAAHAAGATRADAEALRLATLRGWLLPAGAMPPAASTPTAEATPADPIATFAQRVLDVARSSPTGRFGHNKVFISHVWRALRQEVASREVFDARLVEANRTRHLSLTRADLVTAMDPTDVAESEVHASGSSFHFVVI
jgi:hypothetical protein